VKVKSAGDGVILTERKFGGLRLGVSSVDAFSNFGFLSPGPWSPFDSSKRTTLVEGAMC